MAATSGNLRQGLIRGFASRLRFPQLFFIAALLFVVDLLIPDLIPFIDEILLGLLTVLLGMLKAPPEARGSRPPEKNVTDRGSAETRGPMKG